MEKATPKHWIPVLLISLYVFITLSLYTSKMPLFHEEPRRALVAQEMLQGDNWVVPTLYQKPYLKKPPLQNWLMALLSAGNGSVTRFSARLVSTLSLIGIGLVAYLLMLWDNRKLAFAVFIIALTSFLQMCEYGNKIEPDVLITFLTFLSYAIYIKNPTKVWPIVLSSIFMGLGILTKGLSPIYFYPGILLFHILNKEDRTRKILMLVAHLILSLLLPALWLVAYHFNGDINYLFQNYSSEVSNRTKGEIWPFLLHIVEYPARIFFVLFPWTFILVYAFKKIKTMSPVYRSSLFIFIISLIIFTITPGSRDRYLMPAFPFFAVVAGYHLNALKIPSKLLRQFIFGFFAIAGLSISIYSFMQGSWIQGVVLLLIPVCSIWFFGKKNNVLAIGTIIILMSLTMFEHGLYYERARLRYDYTPTAKLLAAKLDPDLPVVCHRRVSYKLGFQLTGLIKRPMPMGLMHDYTHYQYIASKRWIKEDAEVVMTVPFQTNPNGTIYLQIVKPEVVADSIIVDN